MSPESVEWRVDAANCRFHRIAILGFFGALGGVVGIALYLGLLNVFGNRVEHRAILALVAIVVLLIGGPVSVAKSWPMIREDGAVWRVLWFDPADHPEASLSARYGRAFSLRSVVVGLLPVSLCALLLFLIDPELALAFLVPWFVLMPIAALFRAWGRIEEDAGIIRYNTATIDPQDISHHHSLPVGDRVLTWITYRTPAKNVGTRRVVVFPRDAYELFTKLLAETSPPEAYAGNHRRIVVTVSLVFAATFAAIAIVFLLVDDIPLIIRIGMSVFPILFASIFLWVLVAHGSDLLSEFS